MHRGQENQASTKTTSSDIVDGLVEFFTTYQMPLLDTEISFTSESVACQTKQELNYLSNIFWDFCTTFYMVVIPTIDELRLATSRRN